MPRDAAATRERLLRAAEQVFATQGVEAANLRDVNRLAGQRNNSALHYHFGSRAALLSAVLDVHVTEVRRLRAALVAALDPVQPPLVDLLDAVVRPLGARLNSASGRDYLRVLVHLRHRGGFRAGGALDEDASDELRWIYQRVDGRLRCPPALRAERIAVWIDMGVAALAGRADSLDRGEADPLGTEAFVVNLADMGSAALTAPSRVVDH